MAENRRLFIKIFKVELEEIRNDIELLVEIYKERYSSREITHYVEMENEALLSREIHCIEKLVPELDKFDADQYEDKESFINGLSDFLKSFVEENQFPRAVFLLAERKMQKVIKYIY